MVQFTAWFRQNGWKWFLRVGGLALLGSQALTDSPEKPTLIIAAMVMLGFEKVLQRDKEKQ